MHSRGRLVRISNMPPLATPMRSWSGMTVMIREIFSLDALISRIEATMLSSVRFASITQAVFQRP
jgi:hypothetical protein